MLHELTFLRTALVAVTHVFDFVLHIGTGDFSESFHDKGVHLGEKLEFYVFLLDLQFLSLGFTLVEFRVEIRDEKLKNDYGQGENWDRKVCVVVYDYLGKILSFVGDVAENADHYIIYLLNNPYSIFPLAQKLSLFERGLILIFVTFKLLEDLVELLLL